MDLFERLFERVPEAALFLSLAIGFLIGKVKIGKFQLGGVGGSLIAAVAISQIGVDVPDTVKSILFVLFIFAVGFQSGPQFFTALNRSAWREVTMCLIVFALGLATILALSKASDLDKGTAAGVAAGGMTQSAVIGTADDAIDQLDISSDERQDLESNVGVAYAVTYILGSLIPIIICGTALPALMKRSLADDAREVERSMAGGTLPLEPGEQRALPSLVGRAYELAGTNGRRVHEVEARLNNEATVELVKRGSEQLEVSPDLALAPGDLLTVLERRDAAVDAETVVGPERPATDGMNVVLEKADVVLINKAAHKHTLGEVRAALDDETRHGIYLDKITRMEREIPTLPDTELHRGDTLTITGAPRDVGRMAKLIGSRIRPSDKTDFVYLGLGCLVGILIGQIIVHAGSVALTLGSGGGALISGLFFGWFRSRQPTFGELPTSAGQFLRDFGLAGFVAVVGLNSGSQALDTLRDEGLTILVVGALVTLIPVVLALLAGYYLLRYDNAALFAGSLAGAKSANPAFGEVLDKAESQVPTVPFAVNYALANVLLTLLGPLVVGFA